MKKHNLIRNLVSHIFLPLLLIFTITFSSSATNLIGKNNLPDISLSGDFLIVPLAEEICNGYDYHLMFSRGWGRVYKGASGQNPVFQFDGSCWQCKRCTEVLITEYDPLEANYVGRYALWHAGRVISNNGAVIYTNRIEFTSGSTVPYCRLRYE
ncbi:hypothetical protein ACF3M2_07475 [Tissierella carlieri]|jgi:hypothetical protein|uniref:hypothetical protein n=1 Tax=Tissierella carlieri TaxID=689904 RepID=UPI0038663515